MSKTIITGENIFRANTTLKQADIFGLDTTPLELVPAIAGKTIAVIGWFERYNFGTADYTTTGAVAKAYYGNADTGEPVLGATELVTALISALGASQYKTVAPPSLATVAASEITGEGIYLIATTTGFAASGGDGSIEIDVLYQVL